jgi:hypothetical protein
MIPEKIINFFDETAYFFSRLYDHHIGYYLKRRNQYVNYPDENIIDKKIWLHNFTSSYYQLPVLSIVLSDLKEEDYRYEYESGNTIFVYFKDSEIFEKTEKEYRNLVDDQKNVSIAEELFGEKFHIYQSEVLNPKNNFCIKIVPTPEKYEELIKTLISYYQKNNYTLTRDIFNDRLFVTNELGTYITIYTESEAMASEISFIIQSNNLAKIID